MKKHLFLLFFTILTSVSFAFAQSKIDKYCQILVGNDNYQLYRIKSKVKISLGKSFAVKDTNIYRQLVLVNDLTSETDVLNYMSKIGWTLVNAHSIGTIYEAFYFKKTFDSSELIE